MLIAPLSYKGTASYEVCYSTQSDHIDKIISISRTDHALYLIQNNFLQLSDLENSWLAPWGVEVNLSEELRLLTEVANGFKPLHYWHSH